MKSVALISDAKKKGLDVSCSVALHNLCFTDNVLEEFDTAFKVMPPLRTQEDSRALKKGLVDGTIDFVTTDHIPLNIEQKRVEFDNAAYGAIGMESAFGQLNGLFGMEETVELLTRGRERYKLPMPELREGRTACLSLFNPDIEYQFGLENIASTSKNSMAIGNTLKGRAYGVINNGQLVLSQ